MVLKFTEGLSSYEVGRQLHCPHSKALYWKYRFEEEASGGLKDRPRSGRPKSIMKAQETRILKELGDGTGWSTKDVRTLIQEKTGVKYTIQNVYKLMHRWGFVELRPRKRHLKVADEEEVKRFKRGLK